VSSEASPGAMRRAVTFPAAFTAGQNHPLDASPARRLFVPTAIDPYSVPPSSFLGGGRTPADCLLPLLQQSASDLDLLLSSSSLQSPSGDFEAWLADDNDSLISGSSSHSSGSIAYPPMVPSTRPTAPSPSHAVGNHMIIERRRLNDEESEQAREERLIRARGMQKSRSADGVDMLNRLMEPRELDRRESVGTIESVGTCRS
jgi:hypothetical protein